MNFEYYFIVLLNFGTTHNRARNAEKETINNNPKSLSGEIDSIFPPKIPATRLPKKLVKNQTPIVKDRNFFGASFDTSDNPIGERHNSAIVIIK